MKTCQCGNKATVYAIDPIAGGWADYYCTKDAPKGWIVETLKDGE